MGFVWGRGPCGAWGEGCRSVRLRVEVRGFEAEGYGGWCGAWGLAMIWGTLWGLEVSYGVWGSVGGWG